MDITPPFASLELDALGTPDDEVTTVVDVSPWVETKIASLACHRTQITPDGPLSRLPEDRLRDLMRTEYYTLAATHPSASADPLRILADPAVRCRRC